MGRLRELPRPADRHLRLAQRLPKRRRLRPTRLVPQGVMIASTAVRVYNGEDMTFSLMHPSVCANLRMATRRAQSCRHKGKRGSEQAQSSLHRVRPWRGGDAPGMQERYGFMRTPLAHLSSAPDFSCASRRFRTQHRRSHTTKIPDILCGRVGHRRVQTTQSHESITPTIRGQNRRKRSKHEEVAR